MRPCWALCQGSKQGLDLGCTSGHVDTTKNKNRRMLGLDRLRVFACPCIFLIEKTYFYATKEGEIYRFEDSTLIKLYPSTHGSKKAIFPEKLRDFRIKCEQDTVAICCDSKVLIWTAVKTF